MTLPGKTLAVVHVNNNLSPKQSGQLYEIEPNYLLTNEYPNLHIIPMTHNVDIHKTEDVRVRYFGESCSNSKECFTLG